MLFINHLHKIANNLIVLRLKNSDISTSKIYPVKRSLLLLLLTTLLIRCSTKKESGLTKVTGVFYKIEDERSMHTDWSEENTVIVHTISDPDNLHPTNGNSAPRSEILLLTQRTLLNTDFENQSMLPGLVKQLPTSSPDGLSYLYELKSGPVWDDKTPFTTEDILFTAKAYLCPLVNDPAVKSYWRNLQDISIDENNLAAFKVVMKTKNIQNALWFGSFPVLQRKFHDPKNVLANYSITQFGDTSFKAENDTVLKNWATEFNSDKYGRDPLSLNGLGMYKVEKWEPGQFITLIKKKDHWTDGSSDYHERSYPEKIIYKLNKDDNSQQLEFKNQNFDVSTNISMSSFLSLNENITFKNNYSSYLTPTFNYTYIGLNQKPETGKRKPLFTDQVTRKAIAVCIPVDKITKLIYAQYSNQCHQMITMVSPLKKEFNTDLKAIKVDVQAAGKLLSESGWNDTDKDGILDKTIDGKKIAFEADLNYLNTSPDWRDMALLISEDLKKVGIKINPVPMELKLFIEKARSHDFDMMLGSWAGGSVSEDFTQLWHTSNWTNHGSNYCGFGNSSTDALIDSIRSEVDQTKRDSLSRILQKMIYDDQPYVFLYTSMRRNILHKRFANRIIFADRPGTLINPLRLLSINPVITLRNGVTP